MRATEITWDGITAQAQFVRYVSEGKWPHFEWSIQFKDIKEPFTYKTGIGHGIRGAAEKRDPSKSYVQVEGFGFAEVPNLISVLQSLLMDAEAASDTFEDFCLNLGYDTDSRRALETYLECQKTAVKLRALRLTDKQKEVLRET